MAYKSLYHFQKLSIQNKLVSVHLYVVYPIFHTLADFLTLYSFSNKEVKLFHQNCWSCITLYLSLKCNYLIAEFQINKRLKALRTNNFLFLPWKNPLSILYVFLWEIDFRKELRSLPRCRGNLFIILQVMVLDTWICLLLIKMFFSCKTLFTVTLVLLEVCVLLFYVLSTAVHNYFKTLFWVYNFKMKSITRSLVIFKKPRKMTNDFFNHYILVGMFQWTSSECLTTVTITVLMSEAYLETCKNLR